MKKKHRHRYEIVEVLLKDMKVCKCGKVKDSTRG